MDIYLTSINYPGLMLSVYSSEKRIYPSQIGAEPSTFGKG
jgi:hypothetical protein